MSSPRPFRHPTNCSVDHRRQGLRRIPTQRQHSACFHLLIKRHPTGLRSYDDDGVGGGGDCLVDLSFDGNMETRCKIFCDSIFTIPVAAQESIAKCHGACHFYEIRFKFHRYAKNGWVGVWYFYHHFMPSNQTTTWRTNGDGSHSEPFLLGYMERARRTTWFYN